MMTCLTLLLLNEANTPIKATEGLHTQWDQV
jgi:hypothetical protein